MTNTLYVLCDHPAPRIRYVFEHIRIQWNMAELIFFDKKNISAFTGKSFINYSAEYQTGTSIHFIPSPIMDTGKKQIPETIEWINGLPYFFKSNDSAAGLLAFDVPGMIFFMLSRMEEYENTGKDSLGRMEGINSFAQKNDFLHLPVVDLWIQEIGRILFNKSTLFTQSETYHLTIDIDIAWSFAHRPLWENLGGALKEIWAFKWIKLQCRFATWLGIKKDPFEVYTYLEALQNRHGPVLYFILLGDRTSLDRNFHWKHPQFNALIKRINSYAEVGIHPSSKASADVSKLKNEILRLEEILSRDVKKSRQHYLLMNLPDTYNELISAGIKEDYTMGYHDLPGCRAGTVNPFLWYDLGHEKPTVLKVHPFYVMDVTLRNYLKMNAYEASVWMQNQKAQFRKWKLPMTLVWHNSSFFEQDGWKGWKKVLEIIFPM